MKWEGQQESDNVEDDRGSSGGGNMFGGLSGSPYVLHGGIGTLVIILIVSAVFGVNPLQLLQQA
ncbi:MAG TPA: neutral zinc metallopeptidase, partial [Pirellulales bacterium]